MLTTAGYTHYVSVRYGTPIGPGILLLALTLPSSLTVMVTPLGDVVDGDALTLFLAGCGALQAGALYLVLRR